ncbi:MAG: hypothetical protein IT167_20530 [Bryobacterales bacterium]|nr:hypothetical protein [Bryobacterales bacterium]
MAARIAGGQAAFYGRGAAKPLIMREARRNYLIGGYRHSAALFDKVKLTELYPGIDLVFYEEPGSLEYDFLLAPGSDPSAIRLAFGNRAQCSIGSEGDLVVSNGFAAIRHRKPRMYQTAGAAIIAGLYQVNFTIPAAAPSGIVPLVITQGFAAETYHTAVE